MKAFEAFIKPFEVPQRSEKIKIEINFSLCPVSGREGLTNNKKFMFIPKLFLMRFELKPLMRQIDLFSFRS